MTMRIWGNSLLPQPSTPHPLQSGGPQTPPRWAGRGWGLGVLGFLAPLARGQISAFWMSHVQQWGRGGGCGHTHAEQHATPESRQCGPEEPQREGASLKSKKGKRFPPQRHSSQAIKEPDREAEPSSCPLPLAFSWGMRTWSGRQAQAARTSLRGRPARASRPFTARGAWPEGLRTGRPALPSPGPWRWLRLHRGTIFFSFK